MAYTQFAPTDLINDFGIRFKAQNLFDRKKIQLIEPSDWLKESLKKAKYMGFVSEKSRGELLVTPILSELATLNNWTITIYSGLNFNVNESKGLNGECDFILSFSNVKDFIAAPIFAITEAKKQDIESGTIQCAAQLIGAKIFNDVYKEVTPNVLYGCSTTGTQWRFLKYDFSNNQMLLDIERYYVAQPALLLGVLQAIVNETRVAVA